ncbi:MAG TPA: glycoside hydrolase family 57 protein [Planctomycetota bacterium]|nr:glycoside hydrolase family 57 protein [Planctomycetota bacterium]
MPIPLAIIWHQHQPYYKDLASGEMVLPWVRLHGIKDYYGMARLISEFPGVRCTINLVPSMLSQLVDYVEKDATDPFLRRTVIPADGLSVEDVRFILDHFFMAQWDRMIRPIPRYRELLDKRRFDRRSAAVAAEDFTTQDLRDLQVWFNLAWFHPVSFEESEALRELHKKGSGFTEQDKAVVVSEQKKVLARVIPLHKELAGRRQVELTTTPFYHPILPLLCDMRSCQIAMPTNPLPSGHVSLADDAEMQIKRAVEYHKEMFGVAPEGMWPSEGSVSPEIVPLVARHGIKWIATDEQILGASIQQGLRGGMGKLDRPDLLYRPWSAQVGGAKLNIIFRDHHLSDLVGFQYQGWDGAAAADDFLLRVQASAMEAPAGGETLVSVILDGENCWEHYPDQGIGFLRSLYGKLENAKHNVMAVRVSDFLHAHPPQHKIERLYSGSWINHDFYIWVGHQEDRRAWEYVYRAREDLIAATQARGKKAGAELAQTDIGLAHAWEELYIAEGSDWYWWYGDDHTSGNDDAFDNLFRTHLKNVYKFIGQQPPLFLNIPVKGGARAGRYTSPTSSLRIKVDGRCTNYFEWISAGRYRADKEGGVMTAAHKSLLEQVYFGYDQKALCLRIDLHEDAPLSAIKGPSRRHMVSGVSLRFAEPKGLTLHIDPENVEEMKYEGPWASGYRVEAAWDEVLEVRVPFAAMNAKENQEVAFYVEISAADRATERYPRSCALQLNVPPANLHEHEWMA